MNLLFISNYFPPISGPGTYRPYFFVKYLSQKVEKITVITSKSDSVYGADYSLKADWDSVKVVRLGNNDYNKFQKLLLKIRLFPIFNFFFPKFFFERQVNWSKEAKKWIIDNTQKGEYDIIYVTSGPFCSCIMAEQVASKLKLPFIVDMRDPFSMSPARIWMSKWHWKKFENIEKRILTKAKHVIMVAPTMKEHYLQLFPSLKKENISVIFNGFEGEIEINTEKPTRNHISILYAGSLSDYNGEFTEDNKYNDNSMPYKQVKYNVYTRSLFHLMEGISLLEPNERERIKVHVYTGSNLSFTKNYISEQGLEQNFIFHNKVPYHKVKNEMKKVDFLLLPMEERLDGKSYFMTGKLYEYIGANKPILALGSKNDSTDLLDKLGFFYKRANNEKMAIANIFREVIKNNRPMNGLDSENESLKTLKREYQANQLLDILKSAISDQ